MHVSAASWPMSRAIQGSPIRAWRQSGRDEGAGRGGNGGEASDTRRGGKAKRTRLTCRIRRMSDSEVEACGWLYALCSPETLDSDANAHAYLTEGMKVAGGVRGVVLGQAGAQWQRVPRAFDQWLKANYGGRWRRRGGYGHGNM